MTDTSATLDVTALLVGIATVLSAAELISLRAEFRGHGLFDPQVLTSTRPGLLGGRLALLSTSSLAVAQVGLGAAVITCLAVGVFPGLPMTALAATVIVRPYQFPYGGDGADTMARILTITVAIALLLDHSTAVVRIALVFIAAQLCLAYGASGAAKLFGRPWRSGSAVHQILHTAFGHAGLARATLDRWPTLGRLVTWFVVGLELAFPVGIVLGGWFAVAVLVGAAVLQVAIAMALGLNRFTPWFLAAFPATAWAACHYGALS